MNETAQPASQTRDPARQSGSAGLSPQEVQSLKARDNTTNFLYIAQIWLIIAATAVVAIWAWQSYFAGDLHWGWLIPISVLAIASMGASQHNLGAVIHEGTHYLLFRDKMLNELASDWLAGFAIYTSTHAYRLHHFAHHQFVNDPERDPIFDQIEDGQYWLDFPVHHIELLVGVLRLLWPPTLIRYIFARAKYAAIGSEKNPFSDPDKPGSPWPARVGVLFVVGAVAAVVPLVAYEMFALAGIVLVALWAATVGFYLFVPDEMIPENRIKPVISDRWTTIGRMTHLALVYGALTATEAATGAPAWGYYLLLWVVPLFTTFPVFMIFREWCQHGNADRGRMTNTRVFLVDPISRYAVFPLGMEYHLPHHLFASVPHYKLKRLHDELARNNPEYAEKGRVVENWAGHAPNGNPTIIDVLGPGYTPTGEKVHIDEDVTEHAEISGREAIKAHTQASRGA